MVSISDNNFSPQKDRARCADSHQIHLSSRRCESVSLWTSLFILRFAHQLLILPPQNLHPSFSSFNLSPCISIKLNLSITSYSMPSVSFSDIVIFFKFYVRPNLTPASVRFTTQKNRLLCVHGLEIPRWYSENGGFQRRRVWTQSVSDLPQMG